MHNARPTNDWPSSSSSSSWGGSVHGGACCCTCVRTYCASNGPTCPSCCLLAVGVLPFRANLLPAPASSNVLVHVLEGSPLFEAGACARGHLCSQAGLVEERLLHGLGLGLLGAMLDTQQQQPGPAPYRTTYSATLQPAGAPGPCQQQQQQPGAAAATTAAEGYAVGNCLASSICTFLPSAPELAAQMVQRCAGVDAHALTLLTEQALLHEGLISKLQLAGGSSRSASRRQSMQVGWGSALGLPGWLAGFCVCRKAGQGRPARPGLRCPMAPWHMTSSLGHLLLSRLGARYQVPAVQHGPPACPPARLPTGHGGHRLGPCLAIGGRKLAPALPPRRQQHGHAGARHSWRR